MTYFLDFDRTLFDTDAFSPTLLDNPACASVRDDLATYVLAPRDHTIKGGKGRFETWEKLDALCKSGRLAFAPRELARFVFPDALAFLKEHGKESIILTFGHKDWIRSKLESAFAGTLIEKVVYAHDREKGIALAHEEYRKNFSAPYVLIDDLASQLDSVREHCPDVTLYEMRRDGKEGSGAYPVLRSFADLP